MVFRLIIFNNENKYIKYSTQHHPATSSNSTKDRIIIKKKEVICIKMPILLLLILFFCCEMNNVRIVDFERSSLLESEIPLAVSNSKVSYLF